MRGSDRIIFVVWALAVALLATGCAVNSYTLGFN
jgi:hypothetical protein